MTQNVNHSRVRRRSFSKSTRTPVKHDRTEHNRIHLKANNGPGEGGFISRPLRDYWRTDLNLTNKHSKNLTLFANIRNLFARDNYLPNLVDIEGGIEDESISLELGLRYNFQP